MPLARHQLLHDDRRPQVARELGPRERLLDGWRGHVQVVALALAGLGLGLQHGLHHELVAVAPAHERLGVDVLVVLGEVEPAGQRLVDGTTVIAGRQAQLRLDGAAEQRAPVLVQAVALDLDPVRRPRERLHVRRRDPHVLEPQGAQGLEPEHVAHDRAHHVGDRSLLEQVERIGDIGDRLIALPGNRVDPVALGLVAADVDQMVGPDLRPGAGRGLRGDRRGCLLDGHALLRRDPEGGQHVGVCGLVARAPVRLAILLDAGGEQR
jgi:hypothetical protein